MTPWFHCCNGRSGGKPGIAGLLPVDGRIHRIPGVVIVADLRQDEELRL